MDKEKVTQFLDKLDIEYDLLQHPAAVTDEAIKYLDNMEQGKFLTIKVPISRNQYIPVTAMFVGKDKDGRYEFLDTGEMIMSKDLLIRSDITIEKEFNRDDAEKIHKRIKLEYEKAHKKKNREDR